MDEPEPTVYKRVCPQCGSVNIELVAQGPMGACQQWRCPDCGHERDGAPAASEVYGHDGLDDKY